MESASVQTALQVLSLLGYLVAVSRLIQIKFFESHPIFFSYLCFSLLLQSIVVYYGVCSPQFCLVFVFLEPIRIIGYILVAWELRPRGRWPMGIAAIAPIGLILTFVAPGSHLFHGLILRIVRLERGVAMSLAIFVLLLRWFIVKHPIQMSRNSIILLKLCTIWFLGNSGILLISSFLSKSDVYIVNNSLAVFELGLCISWIVMLSKAEDTDAETLDFDLTSPNLLPR